MNDTESVKRKPESHLFHLSVRALVCLMVVGTVCFMAAYEIKIEEPMYSLVGLVVGFYFGQKNPDKPKTV